MGLDEVLDIIKSYERREKAKIKQQAIMNSFLSEQIANRISKLFDSDNEIEIKHVWDYFPSLFEKEKIAYEIKKEEEEFEMFKEKRRKFATYHNQKMKGG